MSAPAFNVPTGHVFRRRGQRAEPLVCEVPPARRAPGQGAHWTGLRRARPTRRPATFAKRTGQAWLSELLDEARRGTLPGLVKTGATFADAAAEYLRWIEHDRERKPSTVRDYRSIVNVHLHPAFGTKPSPSRTGLRRPLGRLLPAARSPPQRAVGADLATVPTHH
jgi:hypothetical protein